MAGLDPTAGPYLSARGLTVRFGETLALDDVSIDVYPGEVVAVTGPSGSGKSTLLHVLAGILTSHGGDVLVGDGWLGQLSDRERSRLRLTAMGFVFQSSDLIPELTLAENVALPLELTGVRPSVALRLAHDALARLGVDAATASRLSSAVSGGQAQRAAVARALVHEPRVVFADEPTGALDSANGHQVLAGMLEARAAGASVLLVTHDPSIASVADRQVAMRDGRVEQQ